MAYSPFEWKEYYLPCMFPSFLRPTLVGDLPHGARYHLGPFYVEDYRSDSEPPTKDGFPFRLTVWHRLTRTDIPRGWWKPPGGSVLYIGFFNDLKEDYLSHWKKRARYYARAWRREFAGHIYDIVPITYGEFSTAYLHSTVAKEVPTFELKKLATRLHLFPQSVRMWGVVRRADQRIVAGINVFDSLENRGSHYGCGFYLEEVRQDPVMVALIDHWFDDSLKKGFRVMHMGIFLPPDQKGPKRALTISAFKDQFVTDYVLYQPPLFKITLGRFCLT